MYIDIDWGKNVCVYGNSNVGGKFHFPRVSSAVNLGQLYHFAAKWSHGSVSNRLKLVMVTLL